MRNAALVRAVSRSWLIAQPMTRRLKMTPSSGGASFSRKIQEHRGGGRRIPVESESLRASQPGAGKDSRSGQSGGAAQASAKLALEQLSRIQRISQRATVGDPGTGVGRNRRCSQSAAF